jgi:hypothetical protein
MPIRLEIEAATFDDLMSIMNSMSVPAPAKRSGRPAKADGVAIPTPGSDAVVPEGNGAAADDMFGDPPRQAMAPTAATPPPAMTQEQFLASMRGLLGKGKDDAVRAKVAEMGYAKVRDVPLDKMAAVYAAAQQA